jgi:hypothetical protein
MKFVVRVDFESIRPIHVVRFLARGELVAKWVGL